MKTASTVGERDAFGIDEANVRIGRKVQSTSTVVAQSVDDYKQGHEGQYKAL
jgi:hypothetical protein